MADFEQLAGTVALITGGELRPHRTAYWESLKRRPSYKAAILDSVRETARRAGAHLLGANRCRELPQP